MEKKVLLMSNATNVFSQNKLNAFENTLPSEFLKTHLKWSAAIESVSLDLKIKNPGANKNRKYPSFLVAAIKELSWENLNITTDRNFTLKHFTERHKFFIEDDESYDDKAINYKFRWRAYDFAKSQPNLFFGFSTKIVENNNIQFGQFDNPHSEVEENQSVMFFAQNFLNELDLTNQEKLTRCLIDDEVYFFLVNSPTAPTLKTRNQCKGLILEYPRIINVCSNKIKGEMNNQHLVMKSFSVFKNQWGKYVTKIFKNSEYHNLMCENINSFDIFLTDEYHNLLRLVDGTPSLVKVNFKAYESNKMERFPLSLNSMQNHFVYKNSPCSFKVQLAEELNLNHGKYKCGVSSITYKNSFGMLSGFNLDFYVKNVSDSVDEEKFFIPKYLKNVEEVREYFFGAISNVADFDTDNNGHYVLKFKKRTMLKIGKDLGRCLGSTSDEDFLEIHKGPNNPYLFQTKPQDMNFYPPLMFIYSDIVSHSIVGQEFCQLLKICPVEHSRKNEYITFEFETIEFLDCPNTVIKELTFDIKSHHGEYLQFDEDSVVFLNLVFQNFE